MGRRAAYSARTQVISLAKKRGEGERADEV